MLFSSKKILISVLLSLCLFALASPVLAAEAEESPAEESLWEKLMPEKVPLMVSPETGEKTPGYLIVQVVTWLMSVIGAIAIGFIVWGAWTYVMSAGNEKKIEEAKRIILYAIIGFVIAILAVVIVQTIGRAVGGGYLCQCYNTQEQFTFSSEEECNANCNAKCGGSGGKCVSAEEAAGEEYLCSTLKPGYQCIRTEECWDEVAKKCKTSCSGYTCIREKECQGTWCCGNNPKYCCCKSD